MWKDKIVVVMYFLKSNLSRLTRLIQESNTTISSGNLNPVLTCEDVEQQWLQRALIENVVFLKSGYAKVSTTNVRPAHAGP